MSYFKGYFDFIEPSIAYTDEKCFFVPLSHFEFKFLLEFYNILRALFNQIKTVIL